MLSSTIVRIVDLIRRLRVLIAARGSYSGEGVRCVDERATNA
jgi:hypothetical protein